MYENIREALDFMLHMICHSNEKRGKDREKSTFPEIHYSYKKTEPMERSAKTVALYQLSHIILKRLGNREK